MYLIKKLIKQKPLYYLFISAIFSLLSACSSGDPRPLYESLIVEFNDVQSIDISALNTVIATGDNQQITVTGTTSQATTVDLSDTVSWSLSDASIASISSSGLLQSLSVTGVGLVTVTASLADFSATFDVTISDASLVSIEVKADTVDELLSGSVCRPLALKAMGTYDDTTVRNITPYVSWSTTTVGSTLVTDSAAPTISHYLEGTTDVTATRDLITSPAGAVTIVDDITSMALSPAVVTLSVGSDQSFVLSATYGGETEDNVATAADWNSADTNVVSFSHNDGVMRAVNVGSTIVTASCGTTQATAVVTVDTNTISSFEIGPATTDVVFTLSLGATHQMTATVYYSNDPQTPVDVTDQVSWTAVNGSVAAISIDSFGLVSADAQGFGEVVANFSGETADLTFHIVP